LNFLSIAPKSIFSFTKDAIAFTEDISYLLKLSKENKISLINLESLFSIATPICKE